MTPSPPPRRLAHWLPPLFLLLLPCLLLWRVVFLGESLVPADLLRDIAPWRVPSAPSPVPWVPLQWDGVAEFYPWRAFAATTLRAGWLPLWNPHQFCGTPFVANSQSAVFYPLNLLLFVPLPTPLAFGVSALVHLALTGLLMYGFLRSPAFGLGRAAAALGAVTWQLSTWQISWLVLPTFLCVSAWLPLALWLTDRLAARPTAPRAGALGVCLGVMLLGGHLQVALYCLLLVFGYGLFRAIPRVREDQTKLMPFVGVSLLALALMVGLAAPQLLPAVELSRLSHRAGATLSWGSYRGYTRLAMPPLNLVTLFLPGFFGSPTQGTYWGLGTNGGPSAYMENACYVGVLGLLLAVGAIAMSWRRQSATRFFAVAALLALLLALGTPLNALLFFGIPGFAQSGSPARILVLWTFCAAVLAAFGAQVLLSSTWTNLARQAGAFVAAFLLLFALTVAYAAAWVGRNAPAETLAANLGREGDLWRLPLGILLGAAAILSLGQRGTLSRAAQGGLLVALAAADLLAVNVGFNRTAPARSVYPVTPAIAFLQQHAGEDRVMPLNRRWSLSDPPPAVLPPNAATVYGLKDTQGYDSLLTGQYMRWAGQLDDGPPAPPENGNMVFTYGAASPLAREAGARYLVSLGALSGGLPGVRPVFNDGQTYIYEDAGAQARVRTLGGVGGAVRVQDIAPTRLRVEVMDASSGGVIVADQWYPGWQAKVGGAAVRIIESPDVFRTVRWTPQQARQTQPPITVDMVYRPTSFRLGLYGMCLALSAAGALLVPGLGRRRFRRGGIAGSPL